MQEQRHEERAEWTAAQIHYGKTWRGVWLSGQVDAEGARGTALERFRDRISPPVEVREERPHEWRITRSGPTDGAVRTQVQVTSDEIAKEISLSARVKERALYATVAHALGIPVGSFTLSFDGNTAYPRDMTEVHKIRIHYIDGADNGSCIPMVFTRAGERHTQAIPRDITEPHLHEIIRRMFGLRDGEYSVRYGGGSPFRVQPQMSITIGPPVKPKKTEDRAEMRRGNERHEITKLSRWTEDALRAEARRKWPDCATSRYAMDTRCSSGWRRE
jgi:hypothetical protein